MANATGKFTIPKKGSNNDVTWCYKEEEKWKKP
jgi:hypothetical protein